MTITWVSNQEGFVLMHMSNLRSSLLYYHVILSFAWNSAKQIVDWSLLKNLWFLVKSTENLFPKKEISKLSNNLKIYGESISGDS